MSHGISFYRKGYKKLDEKIPSETDSRHSAKRKLIYTETLKEGKSLAKKQELHIFLEGTVTTDMSVSLIKMFCNTEVCSDM